MEIVCVMMSTYNGSRYIGEQIDSILGQKGVSVELYIRDDGSEDNTQKIIKRYAECHSNIHYMEGENMGYAKSFNYLLHECKGYRYYAFSDQDDVWKDNKLRIAVDHLENEKRNIPVVYSCGLMMIDENGRKIGKVNEPEERDFEKGRYLLDKYSYGCAMVFNDYARNMAVKGNLEGIVSHDNWIGLIGVFLGKYVFDSSCCIAYRQHNSNVVGGKNSFLAKWKRRMKNINRIQDLSREKIAFELLNCYSEILSENDKELLKVLAGYKESLRKKMILLSDKRYTRRSLEKDILFKILIIISKA